MLVADCWRHGAMGGVIGLDYHAIDIIFNRTEYEISPDHFKGLMLFGREATPILNERFSKDGKKR